MRTFFIAAFLIFNLVVSAQALAQAYPPGTAADEALQELQTAAGPEGANLSGGLAPQDPRLIVARIINAILGLLGTIFLVLIVYAGFLWMTAGGDEGKIEKAKGLIWNGVLGLIIILAAYAITWFVFEFVLKVTDDTYSGYDYDPYAPDLYAP